MCLSGWCLTLVFSQRSSASSLVVGLQVFLSNLLSIRLNQNSKESIFEKAEAEVDYLQGDKAYDGVEEAKSMITWAKND